MKRIFNFCLVLSGLLFPLTPQAEEDGSGLSFSTSGFLTIAAGKVVSGDAAQDFNGYQGPIFIADYGQGGVYEGNEWCLKPATRLGVQGTATFNPQFLLTAQAVLRATRNGKPDLEWAYGSYNFSEKLSLQLGRKRLPLFYYSETQDVGFSYPWLHLPPGQYGWEIVNYNGANLRYQSQWGSWNSSMEVFAGEETKVDNGYWKIYHGKNSRTDSRWSNIAGADLMLAQDWFETRIAYIQSNIQNRFENPAAPPPYDYSPAAMQRIYSLSFSVDRQNWVLRNEYLYMDRKQVGEQDYSFLLGVGYRVGKYLPMLTYNQYRMDLNPDHANPALIDPASIDPLTAERWSVLALSLSYALTNTSDIKVQLDRWIDQNGPGFNGGVAYGNATLLTLGYDLVF